MQDAWEEDREDAANKEFSKVNLKSSRRSRRSRRSTTRSVTSLKNEIKASKSVDYSAMYGNSKVFSGDTSFLLKSYDADEDDGFVDDDFINETLNKFVNCVNYLNENAASK